MNSCSPFHSKEVVSVMWKTVSDTCNLACDYCYYSECDGQTPHIQRIKDDILEKFIKQYMEQTSGGAVFTWQGGEPLLAGLPFFEKVVEFQVKYAPKNTVISNSIQTNGTLINTQWASFFKKYQFIVGISLDGPKEIHDLRRKTGSGSGSFNKVMNGIEMLRKYNVPFTILTVIHEDNVASASELMAFYKEQSFLNIQFLPCMDFKSQSPDQPAKYLISPAQFGDFLCEAFDIWYNDGEPILDIRFFDNILRGYLHYEVESCVQRKTCPKVLILEQNGDAYPCDFYIHDQYKLGNIGIEELDEILRDPLYEQFLQMKPTLNESCRECPYQTLCYGGCPRNRNWNEEQLGKDYFCDSYQQLFKHADRRMNILVGNIKWGWISQYKQSERALPKRNDPCLCGSDRKFKSCCYHYVQ